MLHHSASIRHAIAKVLAAFLALLLLLATGAASAAPKQVNVVYQATKNGQPFATVTESYREENGRYRIESVTKGIGVYALFGERKLLSEGEVTAEGLKPTHFELHQGDNAKKSLFADFDWAANSLTMKVKGNPTTVPLEKGAQDLSSFTYQFMFAPPKAEDVKMPVTTGKKLRSYQYKVAERNVPIEVPAGKFKTVHLANADKEADDDKELWLGAESHYLPVRLTMRDENGAKIEQTLTSLHVE
ncbi:MAG TPA: DUF3108 domain-containing protein [Methylophilaceae bacterium]|nr:DUF3108 domain-containing protein [Methylophilaceae bacterium]